jgi:CDP-diglyceride synthetase
MDRQGLRNVSRRLVIELAAVILLVGFPIDFPRQTSAGRAWSFIVRHPSVLLHVVVGTLILAESIAMLVRSMPGANRRPLVLATIGLAFIVLAYGAGLTFAADRQHDSALTVMSLGWFGAIVAYGIGWWLGHRALAAERRAAASG